MALQNFSERFRSHVGRPPKEEVSLKDYSHFRIGGPADYFFEAVGEDELVRAALFAREAGLRHRIIGGGYNLLFDDLGFRGLILRNAVKGIRMEGASRIAVGSGSTLEELMTFCLDQELGGLEFLVGIPGTIGGAVYGNAGAFDQAIGQALKEARILTLSGEIVRIERDFFAFSYRDSVLKRAGHILLEAVLEGFAAERTRVRDQQDDYRGKRANRHPPRDVACAGSYFKNPILASGEKVSAAFLLDQIGAKGMEEGGAAVFRGHANFIINRGGATSQQVRELAVRLKSRVKERFHVDLEEEVIFLSAEP